MKRKATHGRTAPTSPTAMARLAESCSPGVLRARLFERTADWRGAAAAYSKVVSRRGSASADLMYRYGNAAFRAGDMGAAQKALEAATSVAKKADWLYRYGFVLEKDGQYAAAMETYREALALRPDESQWNYRVAKCQLALGLDDEALDSLEEAIRLDPSDERYYDAMLNALPQNAPTWRRFEVYKMGQDVRTDPAWQLNLARLAAKMNMPAISVTAYARYHTLSAATSATKFEESEVLTELGMEDEAHAALQEACRLDTKVKAKVLGPGALFEKRGRWKEAIEAYNLSLVSRPHSAELAYRIGYCHDRRYEWALASDSYRRAVALAASGAPYWHYKLGHALERQGQWSEAADAYRYALHLSSEPKPHWHYRLANCLHQLGDLDRAYSEYSKSVGSSNWESLGEVDGYVAKLARTALSLDPQSAHGWRMLGEAALSDGDLANALPALEQSAWRNAHEHHTLSSYASALAESGDLLRACEILSDSRQFKLPDGIDLKRYTDSTAKRRTSVYAEYLETRPVDESLMLWESNHGATVGCHPLALFRELNRDARYQGFRHVWAVNDPEGVPNWIRELPNVVIASVHSDAYLRALATAKVLINNVSFPPYFVRREEQRYLNTWHGTPLKTLGRRMKGGILEHENLTRNFLQTTHLMVPNLLTEGAILDDHQIRHLYTGKVGIVGSPRLDPCLNASPERITEMRTRLGLQSDQRAVLFCPTWRGSVSDRTVDVESLIEDLETFSRAENVVVLFRAHRLTESLLENRSLPGRVVPADMDTSELLAAVDCLITDYSSVLFDFLATGKPIVLYTPDLADYGDQRGLYMDPGKLPVELCHSRTEVLAALDRTSRFEPDARYRQAVDRYCSLEDGLAGRRCLEFLFEDKHALARPVDTRTKLLFHASLIPNGIATAFVSLMHKLDRETYLPILVVEPAVLRKEPGRLEMFRRLPEDVVVLCRTGQIVTTPEEQSMVHRFVGGGDLTPPQWDLYWRAYRREARRIFGDTKLDALIEFDGYAELWLSLVVAAGDEATRRVVFQHNQMADEHALKYPNLSRVFSLYRHFDAIASVSSALMEQNKADLTDEQFCQQGAFTTVHNVIDADRIRGGAKDEPPSEVREFTSGGGPIFVSIGRLSPEKNHEVLLTAMRQVVDRIPDAKLVIAGQGPLRPTLQRRVVDLGLSRQVLFTGQVANPYPILKLATAFVLPSLHEGQPVVLFEAMVLGVPVITSDLPGCVEAVEAGYGTVADQHDPISVATAMLGIVENGSAVALFDEVDFNSRAMLEFESVVEGRLVNVAE